MVSWILIGLVLIALIIFFKTTGVRFGPTWTILVGVLIFLFVISFTFILTRPGVDASTFDGFIDAVRIYLIWVGDIFDGAVTITGNAIENVNSTAK